VPVVELKLRAFTACEHERRVPSASPGCAIYANRPDSCRTWFCGYRINEWPADLRPDSCGVVVDPLPDMVRLRGPGKSPNGDDVAAVAMWVAAGYEDAWQRDPVRSLIMALVHEYGAVLWRYRGADGVETARGFFVHEGQMAATQPATVDKDFSSRRDVAARALRAQELLRRR